MTILYLFAIIYLLIFTIIYLSSTVINNKILLFAY